MEKRQVDAGKNVFPRPFVSDIFNLVVDYIAHVVVENILNLIIEDELTKLLTVLYTSSGMNNIPHLHPATKNMSLQ